MECAPRQGVVGRARPGLPELESRSGGMKGTGPTGGARLSAGREGRRVSGWAGRKEKANWAGLKRVERKGRGRRGKMGWAESKGREKEKLSNLATSNSIQI